MEDTKCEYFNLIVFPIFYIDEKYIGGIRELEQYLLIQESIDCDNDVSEKFFSLDSGSIDITSNTETGYGIMPPNVKSIFESHLTSDMIQFNQSEEESVQYSSGIWSSIVNNLPGRNILSYFIGTSDIPIPNEKLIMAIPVLRQNWLFAWQERKLLFFETCLLRVSGTIVKQHINYKDISNIRRMFNNTYEISLKNKTTDVYYSMQTKPFEEFLITKLN